MATCHEAGTHDRWPQTRYRAAEQDLWSSLGVAPRERRVRLPRIGTEVRVQELGDGPPVLFVHGASTCGTSWADLAALLPDVHCLLLDRPGTGLSEPLDPPIRGVADLVALADTLVVDVLDGLGLDSADLVTTSFGGFFGFRAALVAPARIRRIVEFGWSAGARLGKVPLALRLIPDYVDVLWSSLSTDRQHSWTPAEMLELVGANRSPAGSGPAYSSTNYLLLGLVIEQVRGHPVAAVLRDGVLSGDGLERVAYQPDEVPTEPMAMPGGGSPAAFNEGGGYLPSLAGATASGAAGGIASDSASLARWWSRFCGGEIVSEASLNEMTTFQDWYGLGLDGRVDAQDTPAVGHGGNHDRRVDPQRLGAATLVVDLVARTLPLRAIRMGMAMRHLPVLATATEATHRRLNEGSSA